ncbi:endonuclease/exonuclease/phosphatase family protein [Streptomyces sp. NBC_00249]|uniref:endonuclease/exonuclease/phosphatase family protein n=1 Tax=Streptomyces sp. NBC_00249 TaxID=2975690 RepID=UPI00225B1350|nr:endonuclease/exonuclease/phosphatase family protein [Streptomyces sp. NBC_00249]MCX5199353.1 endonuclease/exonuclease/phosphatase family protein [Streptomyces sp. NBC_00249]
MRHRVRNALTTLAALVITGAGVSAYAITEYSAADADGTAAMPYAVEDFPHTLQVMSWNMCGPQRAAYHCEGTGTPQEKIDVITSQVTVSRVEAVLLQEVCEDDLTLLMTKLGPGWSKTFETYQWLNNDGTKNNSRCGEATGRADRLGTAIVAKGQMSDARPYPTTQPTAGQQTPFHCATASKWGVRLCTVHATRVGANPNDPKADSRGQQFAEIKAIVDTFPRVVFGGDFNARSPDDPKNTAAAVWPAGLYSTGPGTPGYQECDQKGTSRTGSPTHTTAATATSPAIEAKIDYIFSDQPRNWCTVTTTTRSDHRFLIESLTVAN